jgi:TetR/AcrR family transcriptional repressor of nem operon
MLAEKPLFDALRWVLTNPTRLEEFATDVGVPRGCLMGNTSAELVPRDEGARDIVEQSYGRFTNASIAANSRSRPTIAVTPEGDMAFVPSP